MAIRREITRDQLTKIIHMEIVHTYRNVLKVTPQNIQKYSLVEPTARLYGHGDLSGEELHSSGRLYKATNIMLNENGSGDIFINADIVQGRNATTGRWENYYSDVFNSTFTDYLRFNRNYRYWVKPAEDGVQGLRRALRPYQMRKNIRADADISDLGKYRTEAFYANESEFAPKSGEERFFIPSSASDPASYDVYTESDYQENTIDEMIERSERRNRF